MRYTIVCKVCKKKFEVIPARKDTAKYCSMSCKAKGVFGEEGYWYGKKRSKEFSKNQSIAQKKRFEREDPWNKGKYKNGKIGYASLHKWIQKERGRPSFCEGCGTEDAKRFEWANISGKYKQKLDDWARLCSRCHTIHDGTINNLNYARKTK